MEKIGWTNFDMKNDPSNSVLMAANTMSKIAAMYGDQGNNVNAKLRLCLETRSSVIFLK